MDSTEMIHGIKGIKILPIDQQGSTGAYVRDIIISGNSDGQYCDKKTITLFSDKKEHLQIKITEEKQI